MILWSPYSTSFSKRYQKFSQQNKFGKTDSFCLEPSFLQSCKLKRLIHHHDVFCKLFFLFQTVYMSLEFLSLKQFWEGAYPKLSFLVVLVLKHVKWSHYLIFQMLWKVHHGNWHPKFKIGFPASGISICFVGSSHALRIDMIKGQKL